MLRATIRGVLGHKLRLALTTLAVMLGVSFVAGTFVLTDTIQRTFDNFFATATAGADVSVRSRSGFEEGAPPVPAEVVAAVSGLAGVEAAEGALVGPAQLLGDDGELLKGRGPAVGTAWLDSPSLNPLTLRQGRPPGAGDEAVIDAAAAEKQGWGIGHRIEVVVLGQRLRFMVVGIAGFGEADSVAGVTFVAFDEATARRALNRPQGYDTVEVAAEDAVAQSELRQRVAAVLPDGLEAVTGQAAARESADRVKSDLGFFGTLLLVFAGVALFVGAFIILNTFQILVAQRSRELGLLRALGASAAQVRWSVVTEAALVGLVASATGLAFGVVVAVGLQRLLEMVGVELPSSEVVVLPRTVVVALAVGMVVTVGSAVLPARRASRASPMAALRDDLGTGGDGSLRRRTVVGALVSTAGFVVLLAGTVGFGNGPVTVGLGAVTGFLGASLIAPAVVRPVVRLLGAPLARLSLTARLARVNALRNPRRTAATAAALMVGLSLVTLVTVFAESARKSTGRVIDDVFSAEFVLNSRSELVGFSPELAARARQLPEVAAVAEFRRGRWRTGGEDRFLTAAEPADLAAVVDLDVQAGRLADLEDGGLLVHEDEAEQQGLKVGDEVLMEFAARPGRVPVRVDGTFATNELTGDYVLSLRDFEANFADQLDSSAMVKLAPGVAPAAARPALDRVVDDFPSAELSDQEEFKEEVAGQVTEVLNLFYALLGLAILIALMGIVNTLALSVFERTRELGLLRAVGTSRRQVRSMVRTEGAIIAVLGAVLGLGVGLIVALAMLAALRDQGITETAVPAGRLAAFVVMAAAAGLVAAVLPARRAARLDILAAIAHE